MTFRQAGVALIACALAVSPAFAQNSTRTGDTSTAPVGTMASPNPGAPGGSLGLATSLVGTRLQQTHGGYLSSKLVGSTVYNDQNQSIGSVDNMIVGQNGQITNVVISVGGFLGINAKLINVPFSQLKFQTQGSDNGREIVLPNASKQSLMSMPAFSYNG